MYLTILKTLRMLRILINQHEIIWKNWVIHCHGPFIRYVKVRVAHVPRMPGKFSPPPQVSDPDMHDDTCVTHVPWYMTGALTGGFLWSWWRGKRSRHSRCMHNQQFYVSGKRPMPDEYIPVFHGRQISAPSRYGEMGGLCYSKIGRFSQEKSLEDIMLMFDLIRLRSLKSSLVVMWRMFCQGSTRFELSRERTETNGHMWPQ